MSTEVGGNLGVVVVGGKIHTHVYIYICSYTSTWLACVRVCLRTCGITEAWLAGRSAQSIRGGREEVVVLALFAVGSVPVSLALHALAPSAALLVQLLVETAPAGPPVALAR